MKESLLNLICCPVCQGHLRLETITAHEDQIEEGSLLCDRCSETYPVHKKMPYLISDTNLEAFKAREREGWVKIWQKKGMYENANLELSHQLPYVGGMWADVARVFDIALQEMNLTGKETILDIGAGQGWASRYFAQKGCNAIALDIVADEKFGLGRSWAIMERANTYFEPLLGDGERLPFPENTFDYVFFCGALHHFVHFERVLAQVHRVLKPGGRMVAAGEPAISLFKTEAEIQAMLEEPEEGIVERRPKAYQYKRALEQVGFKKVEVDIIETYKATPKAVRNWVWCAAYSLAISIRTRYSPFAFLGMLLAFVLPQKQRVWLAMNLNGGNTILRGTKSFDG